MTADWIVELIERQRYVAVSLLMLAENVFPPIPSEVVMPVAGIVASRGEMNIWVVILCGTVGAVAGQSLWFWLGLKIGLDRLRTLAQHHGRWLTISPRDVDKANRWFEKHGTRTVMLGRIVPGVRTLISLPAGLACMRWPKFLFYSTIGSGVWTGVLAYSGFALGERYENVTRYIGPISTVVFAGIVAYYVYRVVTFKKD